MAREIKFRAWNGKGMIVSGKTDLKFYVQNSRAYFLERYGHDDWGLASTSAWTLMQYTGLKDKNGVEIYEGDILQTSANDYREVTWLSVGWSSQMLDPDWIEVIGNIYENPELLR
jgi:uncharacterized phage protein (TIGR01671 family)